MNDWTSTNNSTVASCEPRTHLIIPDTQAKAGVPIDHLFWIGAYMTALKPDVVVHLGDHFDMPSLSTWDKGTAAFEGRRYVEDIEAGNVAFAALCSSMQQHNQRQRDNKHQQWKPELHVTLGNHEHRVTRAANEDPKLLGLVTLEDMDFGDWKVHQFLQPVCVDGIWYCHYWANPMTGKPYGGNAASRLKTIGHTFVQGHQQTLDYAMRFLPGTGQQQFGLICGAAYLHDEDYKSFQGNHHWRGIIVLHQVEGDGSADAMFVSLDYLCRRFEGVRLSKFMQKVF